MVSLAALNRADRGFALLVVLWVVAILSAVSLALIASSRVEARNAAQEWDRLAGERLAHSGQEFEQYLNSRGIGSTAENLSGLPVDTRISGFHYTLRFPEGAVELFLESDDGKVGLSTTNVQLLQNFLTRWTGDSASGIVITDAVKEWSKQSHPIGIS